MVVLAGGGLIAGALGAYYFFGAYERSEPGARFRADDHSGARARSPAADAPSGASASRRNDPLAESPDATPSPADAVSEAAATTSGLSPGEPWPVRLNDVTRSSGITFRHTDGSSGKRYVIESMTGGVALFDYDLDGDLDVYFLNGAPLKGTEFETRPTNMLYRNDGDWHFTDVTDRAGVGDTGYGLGVCAGDYNNDGYPDLYVNNYGKNELYQNRGDGTFRAVAHTAGVANGERVGAGASFLDMDADGDLDLYVANYLQFSYDQHRPHSRKGLPAYPSPMNYPPEPDTVYRNDGDGTFTDVSAESGVAEHAGTGMGVVSVDYDRDGDTDVFVSNDQRPNFLFRNDGDGHFEEVGLLTGTALDFGGHSQATMGVDAGDYDNDGWIDLHTTSFSGELATLYRNLAGGLFEDVTRATGAGAGTFPHVTWGNGFADFDNDGYRDLYIACGHLDDNLDQRGGVDTTAYRVPNVLLRNTGDGHFIEVSRSSGEGMQVALSSRGMALGDLDQDGDVDVVVSNSRREPTLLRNDAITPHHWIKIDLVGIRANRGGVGARVKVVAGDLVQVSEVHSGRGYQSHFGDPLHFGLGTHEQIDRIEVDWPTGGVQVVENPPIDGSLIIAEQQGRPG